MLRKVVQIFAVTMVVLATGCEYIPFSGGTLEGKGTNSLADWREVADVSIVQLETLRENKPYSVNIWMIAEETHLYVFGGDNWTQWMTNMEADTQARVQINGLVYKFSGSRVTDSEEFSRFAKAWLDKYSSDHTESTPEDTFLYRLDPVAF